MSTIPKCPNGTRSVRDIIQNASNSHEKEYFDYVLPPGKGPTPQEIGEFSSRVVLTPTEEKIVNVLLECVHFEGLQVCLRFAGGWVRDKLLGIHSFDIDISIDTMMGEDFASVLGRFLKAKGYPVSSIGVVAARPEQSKHLQTAMLTLFGQKIDFVNLRSEMYTENSRIPIQVCRRLCFLLFVRARCPLWPGVCQILISLSLFVEIWHTRRRCAQKGHHHKLSVLQYTHKKD